MAEPTRTSSSTAATTCTPTGHPRPALPDGSVWRNLVTPEKSKVAETLAEYRGNSATTCSTSTSGLPRRGCRSSRSGTTTRSRTTGTRARSSTTPATRCATSTCSPPARARRSSSACRSVRRRRRPRLPQGAYGPLLDVFVLDMRTYRGPNREPTTAEPRDPRPAQRAGSRELPRRGRPGRSSPRTCRSASSCRTADGPGGRRQGRPRRAPRPRAGDRRGAAGSTRRNGGIKNVWSPPTCTTPPPTTTTRRARRSGTSTRSGSSSPARCTPAPSGRTPSTHVRPQVGFAGRRRRPTLPRDGYQFFGEVAIDGSRR